MKKKIAVAVSLLLVVALSVGGTIAFLTAETNNITNTFTVGNITITLAETTGQSSNYKYKIVPGATVAKDPTITVQKTSEKCYVYAYVDNALILNNNVVATPNVNTVDWSEVKKEDGKTLYRYKDIVDASQADQALPVFTQVTYDGTAITADNINQLQDKTIVIGAFAHQSDNTTSLTADNAAIAHFFPAPAGN